MSEAALNIAIEAARHAGDIIHRYLPKMGRIEVSKKTRNDYVTEVDRACEHAIVSHIRRLHPDHSILAEERGAEGDSDELWIIDPLDGTTNFLHGIPHYAISIAHQVKGKLVAAVIYDPIKEELFTAAVGRGAYLNDQRIRVTPRIGLAGSIMATSLPFRRRRHLQQSLDILTSVFPEIDTGRMETTQGMNINQHGMKKITKFLRLKLTFMQRVKKTKKTWVHQLQDGNHVISQFHPGLQHIQPFPHGIKIGKSFSQEDDQFVNMKISFKIGKKLNRLGVALGH